MAYIEKGSKTEIGKKIEELAKKVPAPLSYLVPDPYSDPTGGMGLPFAPVGMTKMETLKSFLRPQRFGAKPPSGMESVYNTAKIILNYPEKYLKNLKEIKYEPGLHEAILGQFSPNEMAIKLHPWNYKSYASRKGGTSIWETLDHEFAHLAQMTEHPFIFRPEHSKTLQPAIEGTAEWLGQQQAKRVGVPFTPTFPFWDFEQRRIFDKLNKVQSSDPFQTVAEFLRESLMNIKVKQ